MSNKKKKAAQKKAPKPYYPNCGCGQPGTELHACPYNEDVNNNPEPCCHCCAACQHECAMDI